MKENIKIIIGRQQHLLETHVCKIFLFGSFARNEETIYSDVNLALVSIGNRQVPRGASHDFKDAVEDELQKYNRTVGWFTTNEYKLETSTEIFNTNTRIKEEGVLLWNRTVTSQLQSKT